MIAQFRRMPRTETILDVAQKQSRRYPVLLRIRRNVDIEAGNELFWYIPDGEPRTKTDSPICAMGERRCLIFRS
jgi:hypothetical protein